jgi:hypothetical protein
MGRSATVAGVEVVFLVKSYEERVARHRKRKRKRAINRAKKYEESNRRLIIHQWDCDMTEI